MFDLDLDNLWRESARGLRQRMSPSIVMRTVSVAQISDVATCIDWDGFVIHLFLGKEAWCEIRRWRIYQLIGGKEVVDRLNSGLAPSRRTSHSVSSLAILRLRHWNRHWLAIPLLSVLLVKNANPPPPLSAFLGGRLTSSYAFYRMFTRI